MKGDKKRFWRFQNLANEPDHAELLLYGDIAEQSWYGDEATPRQFAEELAALGAVNRITVRINSGGGDVFAAQAIGNQLEQHSAEVTARIDGLCASAATVVACHCDKVEAAEDSTYMVHLPAVGILGYLDEVELGRLQAALATIKENIVALYTRKTGMDREEAAALIEATTWMTGRQAQEKGFVDTLIQNEKAAVVENRSGFLFVNSINTGVAFDSAPDYIKNRLTEKPPRGFENTNPAGTPGNSHKEGRDMELNTTEDLRRECPELVNQIEQAASDAARQAERDRISGIDEVAELFSADLVQEAKYGKKPCNAQELTYRAALAAKRQGRDFLAAAEQDAHESGANGVPGAESGQEINDKDPAAIRAAAKADAAAYNKLKEGK